MNAYIFDAAPPRSFENAALAAPTATDNVDEYSVTAWASQIAVMVGLPDLMILLSLASTQAAAEPNLSSLALGPHTIIEIRNVLPQRMTCGVCIAYSEEATNLPVSIGTAITSLSWSKYLVFHLNSTFLDSLMRIVQTCRGKHEMPLHPHAGGRWQAGGGHGRRRERCVDISCISVWGKSKRPYPHQD